MRGTENDPPVCGQSVARSQVTVKVRTCKSVLGLPLSSALYRAAMGSGCCRQARLPQTDPAALAARVGVVQIGFRLDQRP